MFGHPRGNFFTIKYQNIQFTKRVLKNFWNISRAPSPIWTIFKIKLFFSPNGFSYLYHLLACFWYDTYIYYQGCLTARNLGGTKIFLKIFFPFFKNISLINNPTLSWSVWYIFLFQNDYKTETNHSWTYIILQNTNKLLKIVE